MPVVSWELVKRHLRVRSDSDDELIKFYLSAATSRAAQYLQREIFSDKQELETAIAENPGLVDPIVATADIQMALLLILGQLYENREDVTVGLVATAVPNGALRLLDPYRMNMGV